MCWQRAPKCPSHACVPLCLEGIHCQEPGTGLRSLLSILAQSCSPFVLICASSDSLKVIKNLGFVSQLSCQLAEWPWASHMAAGTQVASSVKGGSWMDSLRAFPASQFHESVKNLGCGIGSGA